MRTQVIIRKITFFFVISFIPILSLSQKTISGEVEISQFVHSKIYTESGITLGVNLPLTKGNISFLLQYKYGGNWETTDLKYQKVEMYSLDYHLIGGEIKYRVLDQFKLYSPTIHISLSTDIASGYRGGYLQSIGVFKNERFYSFEPSNSPQTGGLISPNQNYAYYYISTPLIASLMIGNEFKIIENLHVSLGLGFSIRSVKVGYKEWYNSQPEPKPDLKSPSALSNTDKIKMLDLKLGLSYTFPFKKISQP